jgi:hypothetical protein
MPRKWASLLLYAVSSRFKLHEISMVVCTSRSTAPYMTLSLVPRSIEADVYLGSSRCEAFMKALIAVCCDQLEIRHLLLVLRTAATSGAHAAIRLNDRHNVTSSIQPFESHARTGTNDPCRNLLCFLPVSAPVRQAAAGSTDLGSSLQQPRGPWRRPPQACRRQG